MGCLGWGIMGTKRVWVWGSFDWHWKPLTVVTVTRWCTSCQTFIFFGLSPLPVRVTTRIITFLVGNPYKTSFPLLLGGGTTQHILHQICVPQKFVITKKNISSTVGLAIPILLDFRWGDGHLTMAAMRRPHRAPIWRIIRDVFNPTNHGINYQSTGTGYHQQQWKSNRPIEKTHQRFFFGAWSVK